MPPRRNARRTPRSRDRRHSVCCRPETWCRRRQGPNHVLRARHHMILRKQHENEADRECKLQPPPKQRVCPICGGAGRPWVRTAAANIRECGACRLAFSDRTWLDSASLYTGSDYHRQYISQEPYLRSVFRRLLKEVETTTAGRRLYEIGCGAGILLDEARNRGYHVSGIEYSPGAARAAQE